MIIDITFANYSLATSIYNWKVDNDLHISDHYRILFSINNYSTCRIPDVSDWNYHKGNWGFFKLELDRSMLKWSNSRYWTATSIEAKLNDFLNILNATLTKTIPKKIVNKSLNIHPGGMKNLQFYVQNVGNLPKIKPLQGGTYIPLLEGNIKKSIITAKREGWIKFTSEIKHPSGVSKLIKSFNNCKNNALGLLKNGDGDYCDNPTDYLNILQGKFFPGHAVLS